MPIGLTKPKAATPGTDLAGIVEEVGSAVIRFKVGDEIISMTDTNMGAHAEYITITEEEVIALKPNNFSFSEATGILDGASTAIPFLRDEAKLQPGQHILINGASGGIGTSAVQLAKLMGAEVTGVCSTANVDLVKSLGADHVIDYKMEEFTSGDIQYDVVFDTVGKSSFSKCKRVLKPKGLYLTPVLTFGILLKMLISGIFSSKKAKFSATGLRPIEARQKDLDYLVSIIEVGKLKCVIDKTFEFEEIREAHAYVDTGHKKGNVVLVMNN